ncbi:MAG TPA: ABC transporter substrate-binding protein, partial [Afifellaceae bacterium]|nr:ABC transporter substrate-binding protein [Afifellaceae bacterium]
MNIKHALLVMAAAAFTASPAGAQEAIKIGSSLPLTGGLSVAGQKHKEGYELCFDLINEKGGINGSQIEFISSDNRSDTETALSQYERLINLEQVPIVFGTFSSRLTFPVSAVAKQYDYVYPVPSGGALRIWTRGFDNLFYFQHSPAEYTGGTITRMIKQLVAEGERPKTAAVVHADDFFANGIVAGLLGEKVFEGGKEIVDLSPGTLANIGVEVVFHDKWPEEGFSDWLNLANAVKQSGAEMVMAMTASAEEAVQLTRALQTVKADIKLLYMSQGTQAEYYEGTGQGGEGLIVHSAWHPAANWAGLLAGEPFTNAQFVEAYKKKFGYPPDEDGAIPFAVCQGMEQAIRAVGTDN